MRASRVLTREYQLRQPFGWRFERRGENICAMIPYLATTSKDQTKDERSAQLETKQLVFHPLLIGLPVSNAPRWLILMSSAA